LTEDFLAVVEAKRFLGREFLTWLVYQVEEEGGRITHDNDVFQFALGDRVVLSGGLGDRARLTVVDEGDVRAEIGAGLRRGKLIDRARLIITRGERRWELVLDGGMLTYDALRCPPLGDKDNATAEDVRAGFENDLFLRLADVDEVIGVLDALFADFCQRRATGTWRSDTLPTLRGWVDGLR
jgi:hypothetical protein